MPKPLEEPGGALAHARGLPFILLFAIRMPFEIDPRSGMRRVGEVFGEVVGYRRVEDGRDDE
jgi:hypothetical protein